MDVCALCRAVPPQKRMEDMLTRGGADAFLALFEAEFKTLMATVDRDVGVFHKSWNGLRVFLCDTAEDILSYLDARESNIEGDEDGEDLLAVEIIFEEFVDRLRDLVEGHSCDRVSLHKNIYLVQLTDLYSEEVSEEEEPAVEEAPTVEPAVEEDGWETVEEDVE